MKKFFTKEVRIALVAIVGVIVLFTGMNFLKGIIVFSDDYTYRVILGDLSGLTNSTPVYANGYKVGIVKNIEFDYAGSGNGTTVYVGVDKKLRIPAGSKAEVESDLMGNMRLNIILGRKTEVMIEPNGIIPGRINNGTMGELADMLPAVQALLPKLDSILTSVNTLLADPAIAAMLHNAEKVSANLNTSTTQLNSMMAQLNKQLPGMMAKADNTLANTETMTSNLAQIDVAGTMANVNATLENCKQLTDKLNSAEGTIGKFLTDPSVYNNLNATMRDADSLMIDLKSHPKRYVHFSIFGKKDK